MTRKKIIRPVEAMTAQEAWQLAISRNAPSKAMMDDLRLGCRVAIPVPRSLPPVQMNVQEQPEGGIESPPLLIVQMVRMPPAGRFPHIPRFGIFARWELDPEPLPILVDGPFRMAKNG